VVAQCLRAAFGIPERPGALKGLSLLRIPSTLFAVNSVKLVIGAVGGSHSVNAGMESGESIRVGKKTSANLSAFSLLVVVLVLLSRLRWGMRWQL